MWHEYVWIVVLGAVLAFFTAFGIGANDVANSVASAVGSRAITLNQALLMAGICEFFGAVLLGAHVTETIRDEIANLSEFQHDPELLMYGMLCVLAATGIWLTLASSLEFPVSTTHSIIGGIVGMSMIAKGEDAVNWYEYHSHRFALNKFTGVIKMLVAWTISPFLAGVVAVLFFVILRKYILRKENSEHRAFMLLPLLAGITVTINVYLIVYLGIRRRIKHDGHKQTLSNILGGWTHLIAIGIGFISAILVLRFAVPYIKRRRFEIEIEENDQEIELPATRLEETGASASQSPHQPTQPQNFKEMIKNSVLNLATVDVHAIVQEDQNVGRIHTVTERFNDETENVFKLLQVFTAMCDAFAHGADDVANAVAPFAAIFSIYEHKQLKEDSTIAEWILILGGIGLALGVVSYGCNIVRVLGVKLTKITASRGFSIELGAICVIILGSQWGIPLSTTHCQIGATVGVGLLEGKAGVNLLLLLRMVGGWIITFLIVGLTSAAFVAQGIYAPSLPQRRSMNRYENGYLDALSIFNSTNFTFSGVYLEEQILNFRASKAEDSPELIRLFHNISKQLTQQCAQSN